MSKPGACPRTENLLLFSNKLLGACPRTENLLLFSNKLLIIFFVLFILNLLSPVNAKEAFYERSIIVAVPQPSEYMVHRNLTYLKTDIGQNLVDIYQPKPRNKKPTAAIIFIHGGPILLEYPVAKDWKFFQDYAALVTGVGLTGIVFNHRFNDLEDFQKANNDIHSVVGFVRDNAEKYAIDKERICLWFYSGAGSFVAPFLQKKPQWLKCMAIYYSILGPKVWEKLGKEVSASQAQGLDPLPALESKTNWDPALFIAEAGLDKSALNAGMQEFAQLAIKNGWKVEYWNHPTGPHGFDLDKDDQRSKDIILRTLDFMQTQLELK